MTLDTLAEWAGRFAVPTFAEQSRSFGFTRKHGRSVGRVFWGAKQPGLRGSKIAPVETLPGGSVASCDAEISKASQVIGTTLQQFFRDHESPGAQRLQGCK